MKASVEGNIIWQILPFASGNRKKIIRPLIVKMERLVMPRRSFGGIHTAKSKDIQ